jgi:hypothetical protein
MNSSQDKGAYRIAVAAVGFALIIVLAGICVIVAIGFGHKEHEIPHELWTTASALAGALLGIIAPAPAPTTANQEKGDIKEKSTVDRGVIKLGRAIVIVGKDIWNNRALVVLLGVFAASIAVGAAEKSVQLQALAAASGGVLIGMLAPSPKKE